MNQWKQEIRSLKSELVVVLIISVLLLNRWVLHLNQVVFMPVLWIQELLFILLAFSLVGLLSYMGWRLFRFIPSLFISSIFAVITIGFLFAIEFSLDQNGWLILLSLPWIIGATMKLSPRLRYGWFVSFVIYMISFLIVQIMTSTIPSLLVFELLLVALVFGVTLATPYLDMRKVVVSEALVVVAIPLAIIAGYAVSLTTPLVYTSTNSQVDTLTTPHNQSLQLVQILKPCELCANVQSIIYEPLGWGFYRQVGEHYGMQFLEVDESEIVWVDVSPSRYQITLDDVIITIDVAH